MNGIVLVVAMMGLASVAIGADVPPPGKADSRIRTVTYKQDDVTVIKTRRGVVTRIILEGGEQIETAGTGFRADCSKVEDEWCIKASVGSNQVWVKPKDNATHNNLELTTNRRDYSIEFRVLPDAIHEKASETMYRVAFAYPAQAPSGAALLAMRNASFELGEQRLLRERLDVARPSPRNWQYSQQVGPSAEDIAPSLVFDDGRFTYFRFANNRDIPTIFYISAAGEEGRLNFHMVDDLAVVERISQRFVLRLGDAVVGVWNEGWDADGVAAKDGTTVTGVKRVVKGQAR